MFRQCELVWMGLNSREPYSVLKWEPYIVSCAVVPLATYLWTCLLARNP